MSQLCFRNPLALEGTLGDRPSNPIRSNYVTLKARAMTCSLCRSRRVVRMTAAFWFCAHHAGRRPVFGWGGQRLLKSVTFASMEENAYAARRSTWTQSRIGSSRVRRSAHGVEQAIFWYALLAGDGGACHVVGQRFAYSAGLAQPATPNVLILQHLKGTTCAPHLLMCCGTLQAAEAHAVLGPRSPEFGQWPLENGA
jgi:hypothetical protein